MRARTDGGADTSACASDAGNAAADGELHGGRLLPEFRLSCSGLSAAGRRPRRRVELALDAGSLLICFNGGGGSHPGYHLILPRSIASRSVVIAHLRLGYARFIYVRVFRIQIASFLSPDCF